MCIDFRLKKMMIVEIVILVISDEKSLSFMERLYKKSPNWDLSYNNLYMHKKQYIYENTLNPKSTQFIFPYIKCSRIFHFLTKCFPYQNFKIIDIKFWKECISIFNI